jgi:hypothetical protein
MEGVGWAPSRAQNDVGESADRPGEGKLIAVVVLVDLFADDAVGAGQGGWCRLGTGSICTTRTRWRPARLSTPFWWPLVTRN